jgi:hypothetical protein
MEILKSNVTKIGNDIYSYNTKVAVIEGKILRRLDWELVRKWNNETKTITKSPTTNRHIKFVAEKFNLNIL